MKPSDRDIEKKMLSLARVDPEQFLYFYEKYYDTIYQLVFYRVLNHEITEDLVSETFLRAQESLGRFHWRGVTIGAWLYRIAMNQVNAHYRKADRLLAYGIDMDEAFTGPGPGPMAELLQDEDQRRLYAALAELDDLSVNIFVLHYWERLKVRQIALVLKVNENTVRSRLMRDRRTIRDALELEHEGADLDESLTRIKAKLIERGGDDDGR